MSPDHSFAELYDDDAYDDDDDDDGGGDDDDDAYDDDDDDDVCDDGLDSVSSSKKSPAWLPILGGI